MKRIRESNTFELLRKTIFSRNFFHRFQENDLKKIRIFKFTKTLLWQKETIFFKKTQQKGMLENTFFKTQPTTKQICEKQMMVKTD